MMYFSLYLCSAMEWISKYTSCYKSLLTLASPVIASQAGQMLVSIVDTAMVGSLGKEPLAAVAFAGNLTVPVTYAGIGVAICTTPLIGKRIGRGRDDSAITCMANARIVNFALGLAETLVLILLWWLLPYMGQPTEVVEITRGYLPILIASIIPMQMFMGYKQIIEGLQNTSMAMKISIAGNIINVIVNYILIYGWWIVPAIGVNGAAWGTLVSRLFMWIAIFICFKHSTLCKPYSREVSSIKLNLRIIKRLFLTGLPVGGQMIVECISFAFGGIMMGWISAAALAAHQVVMSFTSLTYMMVSGLASAVTIKVSVFNGQNDNANVRRNSIASIHIATAFMALSSLCFVVGRKWLPSLFIDDTETLSVAMGIMLVGASFQIFDGLQMVSLGVLRGLGDMRYPAIVSGVAYAATCIPVAYLIGFVFEGGPNGVWCGYIAGLLLASVMLLCRIRQKLPREKGVYKS